MHNKNWETKQKTSKGLEIPVPKRRNVLGDLKKVAKGLSSGSSKK